MNLQWFSIFEDDIPMKEQLKDSLENIGEKPARFFKMFWLFFLQFCIAISLVVFSILFPIWILYG